MAVLFTCEGQCARSGRAAEARQEQGKPTDSEFIVHSCKVGYLMSILLRFL